MWILCQAEDSQEISSTILSEKQWKNIQDCRLLLSKFITSGMLAVDQVDQNW